MHSISTQFYLKFNIVPLSFDLEITTNKFDDNIEQLDCWAFTMVRGEAQVVGFAGNIQKSLIPCKILVRLNQFEVFTEILVSDYVKCYLLKRDRSASDYGNKIDILNGNTNGGMYHQDSVQDVIGNFLDQ